MTKENITEYLLKWSETYRDNLIKDILPFWINKGLDVENGGFYTCLDRDGTVIDSTKSVWFQGRAAYIYSKAYNTTDKNEKYLFVAKSSIDFIEKHCFDSDKRMFFEVEKDGTPLRKRRYLFSECFAAMAMAEYSLATNDKEYAQKALEIFKLILKYKNSDTLLEPKYLPTFKVRGHSLTMMLINVATVLKQVIKEDILQAEIDKSIFEIKNYFIKPEFKALLETVGENGEFIDSGIGRTVNPGHCIETSWFILQEAMTSSNREELTKTALQILDWSWEWGWDTKYGGIINFKDCKGLPHQDYSQDMKFWWPHTETIVATLYAYKLTKDTKYIEMFKKVNDWTYNHFPDSEYGEWYGYLHRDGSVAQAAKGNLFKGPFHIPRMMIYANILINDILNNTNRENAI